MADKTTLLLLGALRRALAEPTGLTLHGGKGTPGLFPSTALGKQAAQRCLEHGLLQPHPGQDRLFILGEQGLSWLMHQASPRTVLEDFVRALEARAEDTAQLIAVARQMQTTLEGLQQRAEQVLQQLPAETTSPASTADDPWKEALLQFLQKREFAGVTEDCPLPELYQQARQNCPALTIGGFHDGLRSLHENELIYLHPWTGPLYALPEPALALLVGHEIAYYASPRRAN